MAAAAAEDDPLCGDGEDILGSLWDDWAKLWEQEFRRQGATEDAFLARRVETVNVLADHGDGIYAAAVESAVRKGDEAAKRISRFTESLEEMQHAHQVAELKHSAEQARSKIVGSALQEAQDEMTRITENAAIRRQEREMKRLADKRAREAALEAKWRQREEAEKAQDSAPNSGAGDAGKENYSGGGDPKRGGAAPPPRFTRLPSGKADINSTAGPGRRISKDCDAAWAQFERRAAQAAAEGGTSLLLYTDVPWPVESVPVSGVEASDSLEARKRKLRAAVLRWHPDKWGKILDHICASDRPKVVEQVKAITRKIFEERKRFLR